MGGIDFKYICFGIIYHYNNFFPCVSKSMVHVNWRDTG